MNCGGEETIYRLGKSLALPNFPPLGRGLPDRDCHTPVGRRSCGALTWLLLFASASLALADDPITDLVSPVVSYQYYEGVGEPGGIVVSPVASYQYFDSLGDLVSWQSDTTPTVSYFYNWGGGGPPIALRGQVIDAAGAPIAGAQVAISVVESPVAEVHTDGAGAFELQPLALGVYALSASAPGKVTSRRVVSLEPQTAWQSFVLKAAVSPPAVVDEGPSVPLPATLLPLPPSDNSRLVVFDGQQWSTTAKANPNLATVVLTHGWLRCVDETADPTRSGINDWPLQMAKTMSTAGVSSVANIVAWDWYAVARPCSLKALTPPPEQETPVQGILLGKALYDALGSDYSQPMHFLGHSLGTLVNSYAIDYLHGYTRSGHEVANPAWKEPPTQVTLFDEAAIARLLSSESGEAALAGLLRGGLNGGLVAYGFTASQWKNPIPHDFTWLENYVSCVGRYHAEGLNILLQRPMWEGVLDDEHYIANFLTIAEQAHGYPITWYLETIPGQGEPTRPGYGWGYSVEESLLPAGIHDFPPNDDPLAQPGVIWRQKWGADNHELERAEPALAQAPPVVVGALAVVGRAEQATVTYLYRTANDLASDLASGVDVVVDWVGDQASAGATWAVGTARKVGNVTLEVLDDAGDRISRGAGWVGQRFQQGYAAVLDLVPNRTVRATLSTTPPAKPGPRQMASLMGDTTPSNTPAYLWLPIYVPEQVQWMAFDFALSGNGNKDALVFGLNGTNLFALASEFIPATSVQTSSPIDMTPYAGSTNEFFFGVVGGTSTNCTITVKGLRFYSFTVPTLSIANAAGVTLLAWPTTAVNYALETTPGLSPPAWTAVTNPPTILGNQYVLTNVWSDQTRFFRLRQE